jgi:branched-subunit amino acid transport protein AzlD
MDTTYTLQALAVMGLVTFGLRALPFVAAQWLERHQEVRALGRFLPLAIMALLVLHSGVGAARGHAPLPEALAIGLVAALQWWGRNALVSILTSTALYVWLRNYGPF